jgi:hypothetical protein
MLQWFGGSETKQAPTSIIELEWYKGAIGTFAVTAPLFE